MSKVPLLSSTTWVKDRKGDVIYQLRGSIKNNQLQIDNLVECTMFVFDWCGSVVIDDCIRCTFVFGPVTGSIFVRDCRDCEVAVACQQFRCRGCKDNHIRLYCRTEPVVETTTTMSFSSYNVAIPQGIEVFEESKLDYSLPNLHHKVHDFSKSDTSIAEPHFTYVTQVDSFDIYDFTDPSGSVLEGSIPDDLHKLLPTGLRTNHTMLLSTSVEPKPILAKPISPPSSPPRQPNIPKDSKVSSPQKAAIPSASSPSKPTQPTPSSAGAETAHKPLGTFQATVKFWSQKQRFGRAFTEDGMEILIFARSLPRKSRLFPQDKVELEVVDDPKSGPTSIKTTILDEGVRKNNGSNEGRKAVEIDKNVGKSTANSNRASGKKQSAEQGQSGGAKQKPAKPAANLIGGAAQWKPKEEETDHNFTVQPTPAEWVPEHRKPTRGSKGSGKGDTDGCFAQQTLSINNQLLPGTTTTTTSTHVETGHSERRAHVIIRHYLDEDHPQMKTFLTESNMFVKSLDNRQVLRKQIEFDPTSIIVAQEGNLIIGTVYTLYNPWQAFIYHLCVHPGHRNKNVANMLMDKAEAQLKARGIKCPTLFIEAGNKTVSSFYEKRGWFGTDPCLCMGKDL